MQRVYHFLHSLLSTFTEKNSLSIGGESAVSPLLGSAFARLSAGSLSTPCAAHDSPILALPKSPSTHFVDIIHFVLQRGQMDIKDLILNLSVNKEPVAHLPQTSDNGPLVITHGLLESIDSGAVDGRKLVGWKGDVLWTTGAMLWLASKELI